TAESLNTTLKNIFLGAEEPNSNDPLRSVLACVDDHLKPLVIEPFLTPRNIVNYARQLLSFWEHDIHDALPSIEVPVLFVCGEADTIAPPGMSRMAAESVPKSAYVEIKG